MWRRCFIWAAVLAGKVMDGCCILRCCAESILVRPHSMSLRYGFVQDAYPLCGLVPSPNRTSLLYIHDGDAPSQRSKTGETTAEHFPRFDLYEISTKHPTQPSPSNSSTLPPSNWKRCLPFYYCAPSAHPHSLDAPVRVSPHTWSSYPYR